ncbi:unnamed protein product, partial [Parascedosporium putredinis]
NMKKVLKGVRK